MNKTKFFAVIVLIVIAFGAGMAVDRYALAPPRAAAPEPIVFGTWGGAGGEASVALAANFTRQTGIPVLFEYHAGASGTVIPKISSAWPTVKIDVIAVAPGVAYQLAQQGYLAELKPEEIPVMKEIPDSLFVKYNGTVIGAPMYVISVLTAVWRTDVIKEPIAKWSDLFKPEYNKKIATSYLPLGTGSSLVDTAYLFGGDENNVEVGFQKLKELAPHIGGLWTTEAECVNFLASGQYPIELFVAGSNMFTAHKQGIPLAWTAVLDTGTGVTPKFEIAADVMAVIKGPRAAEAKEFVNFFLNAQNNGYYNAIIGLQPSNKNAKMSPELVDWVPNPDEVAKYGRFVGFAERAKNIDAWTTRWDSEITPLIGTG